MRAFQIAMSQVAGEARPKIAMLDEDNMREGFFEREQFEAVRAKVPEPFQAVVTFACITGWRVNSEVLQLQWTSQLAGRASNPERRRTSRGASFP